MRLEIIDDAEQKHVKSFTKNRVLIGRSKEADFCIEGGGISRQHLVIEFSNGKYFAVLPTMSEILCHSSIWESDCCP
jgi:predicted component of type VI protein secretion system